MKSALAVVALGFASFLGCSSEEPGSGLSHPGAGGMMVPSAGAGGTGAGAGGTAGPISGGAGGLGGAAGTMMVSGGVGGMAGGGGAGGAGGMMTGGTGGMGASGPTLSTTLEVLQIPPGGQMTVCTTKHLDNTTEVKVKNVRGHISGGSHHFIVDRDPTDIPIVGLEPCFGLSGTDATRVLIAEKPETLFAMPAGVGFTLRPNQPLTAELHYFNPTDAPIDVEATIEFELAEGEEAANMKEASMVFAGNTHLLPAKMSVMSSSSCDAGARRSTARFFRVTSHTHSLVVRSTIERVADAFAPPGEQLHESLSWAEPPMTEFMPPLDFTGEDGLRLKCEYVNDRDVDVVLGTAVQDEMCFMWLYYY